MREELSLAAAEVDDGGGGTRTERSEHGRQALLVEAQRTLERALLRISRGRCLVLSSWLLLSHQPIDRVAHERVSMLQVASGDHLALGVGREPALPVAQQLLDFVVADPVVL